MPNRDNPQTPLAFFVGLVDRSRFTNRSRPNPLPLVTWTLLTWPSNDRLNLPFPWNIRQVAWQSCQSLYL